MRAEWRLYLFLNWTTPECTDPIGNMAYEMSYVRFIERFVLNLTTA